MFANLEFAIYHRLKNKDMIKNLVKVLESRVNARDIPPLNQSLAIEHKSQIVLYNYYLGQYYGCLENDHERGFFHLNEALLQCPLLYVESTGKFVLQHQMEKIMGTGGPIWASNQKVVSSLGPSSDKGDS